MKVFVFTPNDPVPCFSGAQRRIVDLLYALRELGADVHMTGCQSLSKWTPESSAWLLENGLSSRVSILPDVRSPAERFGMRARRFVRRRWSRVTSRTEPLLSLVTPAMRRWYRELMAEHAPDRVIIHYAWYSDLVLGSGAPARSVLESQDLVTLNETMRRAIDGHIGRGPIFRPESLPEEVVDLRFYDAPRFTAHPSEFRTIDGFDTTLAISESEAQAIRAHTRNTDVHAVASPATARSGPGGQGTLALLPMGPHPFNLQGYAWFVRRVLPRIRGECPDFELGVTGILYRHLRLEERPQVRNLGFIRNPDELWSLGRMLVNPVFGGTGQPIKTIEAMAAGLPPVILDRWAATAPVVHGVNGFVARDEAEFAACCIELWRDPQRCRDMGAAAMEAVRAECSRERFTAELHHALDV